MTRRRALRIVTFVVLLVGVAVAVAKRDQFDEAHIRAFIDGLGPWGPLAFIALYAVAALFFLPGSVLTVTGGALFGPVLGTIYNLTGAVLGATLAFLAARHIASDWVRERTGKRLDSLISGVEQEGWRFVAFVRLVPVFPFNLLNYALGLTKISLPVYVVTSAVCMAPGGLAYTYVGYAGREALGGGSGALTTVLIALALVGAALFLPRAVKRFRSNRPDEP